MFDISRHILLSLRYTLLFCCSSIYFYNTKHPS
nr:MAG TPA: hypothetical protein [Caudoviricetes sp.]